MAGRGDQDDLIGQERQHGQVQEAVLRNQLDVAVVGPPLSDPDLAVLPFLTDEIVLVAPAGHPLSGRRGLSLRDLQGQAFIMREAGSSTRWELDKAARRERVELNVAMELGSNGAIKHAVEGGLGLCALSRYAIELERSSGGLVVLDVTGFPLRRRWHIVHLRRRRLPAAVAGFVELLRTPGWLPQVPRS
jgi:DNA-binding transcriptional LysR family regulator